MNTTRYDDAIADRFELALASAALVPFGSIQFRLQGGTITLMGSTASPEQRAAIYDVIEDFPMLVSVDDRLDRMEALRLAA